MLEITISNAVRADHEEVRAILRDAFAPAPAGVEIHVKARRPRVTWRTRCWMSACVPRNWVEHETQGHWYTTKKAIEAVAAYGPHGPIERVVSAAGFSGRAYNGVPRLASVCDGIAYLVTLHMPGDPAHTGPYPAVRRYPGLKTAPPIAVNCWREELFALAAHEAHHLRQFADGGRVSEVEAEKAAVAALHGWRHATLF